MRWSRRFAFVGLLLVLAGLGVPYLIPADEDYEYTVVRPGEYIAPDDVTTTPVEYRSLSPAEKRVFDRARSRDETVRTEEEVDGSHYTYFSDSAGYGNGLTAVDDGNETYVVTGSIVRQNWALRYWGRPLLVLLGLTVGTGAAVAFLAEQYQSGST